ncbi:hypothetical protein CTAYLR_005288 [Chrysophaeum taylorii]|uniref:MICOS complex subunit MIC60 n=1 Tax=Chrysophaeum taylorii TaxID=2483200 RepID=A0AAD7UJZ8_9STRA|nr:hypothetical protein CTAYLR_005288 [Chrysophaeum taylorii]
MSRRVQLLARAGDVAVAAVGASLAVPHPPAWSEPFAEASANEIVVSLPPEGPTREERIAALKAAVRAKKAAAQTAAEWEARRLQQVLKEVERETRLQRELEIAAIEDAWRLRVEAAVEEKRRAFALEREEAVEAAKAEAAHKLEVNLRAYDQELSEYWAKEVEDRIEDVKRQRTADVETAKAEWHAARAEVEFQRQTQADALEHEVRSLLARFDAKTSEHAAQIAAHKQTVVLMNAVFALSSHAPAKRAVDAVLKAADDDLVLAALRALPDASLRVGVPQIVHLEDRFVARVDRAIQEWLLLPEDLDDGIFAHILAYLFAAAGFTTPPVAIDATADARPMRLLDDARDALVKRGDLRTCVAKLQAIPAKRQPNPARDWIHDATTRVLADQALVVLRAKIALLNAQHLPAESDDSAGT